MSTEKLKKRKLREKNKETLGITIQVTEPKILEKKEKKEKNKKKKCGLNSTKRWQNDSLETNMEDGGDTVDGAMDLAKKKKKKNKSGSKNKDGKLTHSDGIDYEDLELAHKEMKHEKKSELRLKKKRKRDKANEMNDSNEDRINIDDNQANDRPQDDHARSSAYLQTSSKSRSSKKPKKASREKLKKERKHKQKDFDIAVEQKSEETFGRVEEEVEEIQLVDEDCSKGMKKWLIQYKESRPGLNILQERIDDFITAYEERQEQERKEREAQVAEGGWTVVVHHKGRKKTTDTETGVTVGSIAQAAVLDKMGKKKSKEVPLDFYRFQKREAQRKEVMMLQTKFEQDKKRIQQLRAARKFRPY